MSKSKRSALIGIMVSKPEYRRRTMLLYKRLVLPGMRLPIRLIVFCPQHLIRTRGTVRAMYADASGILREKIFSMPHVVINRCYGSEQPAVPVLRSLIGVRNVFNSSTQFNKWQLYQRLSRANLRKNVPLSMPYRVHSLEKVLNSPGEWFIKPVYGNRGEHVHRITRTTDDQILVASHTDAAFWAIEDASQLHTLFTDKSDVADGGWLIQKAIDTLRVNDRSFDVRALIQKGRSGQWRMSALTCRVARAGFFNTSAYSAVYEYDTFSVQLDGDPLVRLRLRQQIEKLALLAAHAVETKNDALAEVSVDFVLDQSYHPWIVELNASPQKTIYREIRGFRNIAHLYRAPLLYAYHLYEQQ